MRWLTQHPALTAQVISTNLSCVFFCMQQTDASGSNTASV
jgi:membrane-bound lytic murein transglycosylase